MAFRAFVIVVLALALAGCDFFPVSGPSPGVVRASATSETSYDTDFKYELVNLTPETAELVNKEGYVVLSDVFKDRRPLANIRIGVGDVIAVSIFEAAAGGLFIPAEAGVRAGNFVTLQNQTVDNAGFISVPYAGLVKAAGRTPGTVQQTINSMLNSRAIEPQAVVSIVEQRSQLVSVVGEVNQPARLPVTVSGERLLDSIARAGGIKEPGPNVWVRLIRDGKEQQVHFPRLTSEPRNNIYTMPNDTIYVYRDPPSFLAFGASGTQGQFPFDVERQSLAEAVAKAGGLLDDRANPGAIFLFRKETRTAAASLGIDVSKYSTPEIPVIYSVNFRNPKDYFTATKFLMRNKDVIYVTNAAANEVVKFVSFLRLVVAAVRETNAARIELPQ
jgi:polysaccharide export outer membrane protein